LVFQRQYSSLPELQQRHGFEDWPALGITEKMRRLNALEQV
jgi:hypothetical protein